MRNFAAQTDERGKTKILRVEGRLDHEHVPQFMEELKEIVEGKTHFAVVNCKDVVFMSSLAWGSLISSANSLKTRGGRLVLCELSGALQATYDLLSLQHFLPAYPSEAEALQNGK